MNHVGSEKTFLYSTYTVLYTYGSRARRKKMRPDKMPQPDESGRAALFPSSSSSFAREEEKGTALHDVLRHTHIASRRREDSFSTTQETDVRTWTHTRRAVGGGEDTHDPHPHPAASGEDFTIYTYNYMTIYNFWSTRVNSVHIVVGRVIRPTVKARCESPTVYDMSHQDARSSPYR